MNTKTKKIVLIGMFSAMAFVLTNLGHLIPIVFADFLRYDPKDFIIVISGFALGPLSALIISIITAFIEMITISQTGLIGFLMNVIASASFACAPAILYKKKRSFKAAIMGLIIATLLTTTLMLLWNYIVTPFYMQVPREAIAEMLFPVFLPFNLLKCGLNSVIVLILYKPIVRALRALRLLEVPKKKRVRKRHVHKLIVGEREYQMRISARCTNK